MKINILGQSRRQSKGFSLVEVLVVIAIISILATLVISSFSNAAQDSREIMARQQQAVVQSAVSNWVASEVGTFYDPDPSDTTPGRFQSIGDVLSRYNAASTGLARLALVRAYLDDSTYSHITNNTTDPAGNQLKSGAMTKVTPQRYLQMPNWVGGSYPKVELLP
ncbi:MAG: type II secretion system protein [Verrucomicrobiae bacterium]|nr:type II secretion system protein [Verrucomicrobiae bacterium]